MVVAGSARHFTWVSDAFRRGTVACGRLPNRMIKDLFMHSLILLHHLCGCRSLSAAPYPPREQEETCTQGTGHEWREPSSTAPRFALGTWRKTIVGLQSDVKHQEPATANSFGKNVYCQGSSWEEGRVDADRFGFQGFVPAPMSSVLSPHCLLFCLHWGRLRKSIVASPCVHM